MTIERLKQILVEASENKISLSDINEDSDIVDNLNFNSIMYLKAVMQIEDESGVELDDEDIDTISKVSQLLNVINSKQNS